MLCLVAVIRVGRATARMRGSAWSRSQEWRRSVLVARGLGEEGVIKREEKTIKQRIIRIKEGIDH